MFCRNCANEMDPRAVVCVKCGVPVGAGDTYCPNCAAPTPPGAVICTNCGVQLHSVGAPNMNGMPPMNGAAQKSKIAAGLLGVFLGSLGIHNFYLGYTSRAVAQLLITLLSCGLLSPVSAICGLVEGILILTGDRNVDANGTPLRE